MPDTPTEDRTEEYLLFILGRIEDYVPGSPSPIQTDMEVSDKPKGGGPVSFNRNFSCNLNFANRFFDLAMVCNLTCFRVLMVMAFWTLKLRNEFQDLFFFFSTFTKFSVMPIETNQTL